MEVLVCTKCKVAKEANTIFFPPHNKKKNGLDSWCRSCRSNYRNEICRGKFRTHLSDEKLKELRKAITSCVICEATTNLVVDHDHKTNKVRGILCNNCNLGIGHFKDNPLLLEFASQYLHAANDSGEWVAYNSAHGEESK